MVFYSYLGGSVVASETCHGKEKLKSKMKNLFEYDSAKNSIHFIQQIAVHYYFGY